MMPSTEREYKNKIRQLQEEKDIIGAIILQEVTRIINESDVLTPEQRDVILHEIWKGRNVNESD